MRLIKAILHNFRQYKHQEIKIPNEGLIGVLGKNGAGKSTLFNAVGWCLYGKIKDVNKDDIKNLNAGKKEPCYVELFFEFQNTLYHAKRHISKTNECYLKTADGIPHAVGTSNLSSYVEENLFKMDYNAFCACYYAEQDDFDNLVKLTPAKRVTTVSKLLRIETIDKAAEDTRKEYRILKSEVDEARKHLKDENELNKQKSDLQFKTKEEEQNIKNIDKDISLLDTNYKELLVKKAEGEKDYHTHTNLLNTLKNSQEKIETLKKRSLAPSEKRLSDLNQSKKRYEEIEKYKKVYPFLEKQKEDMQNTISDFREKLSIEKEMKSLEKDVTNYRNDYDALKVELKSFDGIDKNVSLKEQEVEKGQDELAKLKESFQENNFIIKSKKDKIDELKSMKNKFNELGKDSPCPTCERPLGEHYEDKMTHIKDEANEIVAQAKVIQEKNNKIEQKANSKKEHLIKANEALSSLRNDLMKKNSLNERFSILENEVKIRKEKYSKLQERFDAVKDIVFDENKYKDILDKLQKAKKLYDEILGIENQIKEIPTIEETIEEVKAEIENLAITIDKCEKEIKVLKFDEKEYNQLSEKITNTQTNLQDKKDARTKTDYRIKEHAKDITLIDEKLKENKELLNSIKDKEEEMVLLGKLDESYKQFKTDILSKLAPALSEIMSDDIEALTDGKYNQIELDDDYNIHMYRDGTKKQLSFFSGGEKKLAALCLRLAISGLLVNQTGQANFDMLAMDEVFGAMDTERQDNILEMLRNLNEKFKQILIVSHSENVKDSFDYVLQIKQDADGNSTFSWQNEWDDSYIDELLEEYSLEKEIS